MALRLRGPRLGSRIHLEPQAEQLDRLGPLVRLGRLFRVGPLLVAKAENGGPDTVAAEPELAGSLQPTSPEGRLKFISRPTSQGKQREDFRRSGSIGLGRTGEGLKQNQQDGDHPLPAKGTGGFAGKGHDDSSSLEDGQERPDW